MIVPVDVKSYKPLENTYIFSSSALYVEDRRNKTKKYYDKILELIEKGKIYAAVTLPELGKLKSRASKRYEKEYLPVWESYTSIVYFVRGNFSTLRCYPMLEKLYSEHQLHFGDLTSVTVAIEFLLPLVTEDFHHWNLQSKFQKIFNEIHKESIAKCIVEGKKTPVFQMFTTKDLYKL